MQLEVGTQHAWQPNWLSSRSLSLGEGGDGEGARDERGVVAMNGAEREQEGNQGFFKKSQTDH